MRDWPDKDEKHHTFSSPGIKAMPTSYVFRQFRPLEFNS